MAHVIDEAAFSRLVSWITERESIRVKKCAGAPRPWTDDHILNTFRFCNVNRENDAVTKWIAENWRIPGRSLPDLWFWMLIARLLNLPESMSVLARPGTTWNAGSEFVGPLKRHRAAGGKVFNAAYIVSTNGVSMDKIDYLAEHVLLPAWKSREYFRPRVGDTLDDFYDRLTSINGVASFIAGQVVADMRHVKPLSAADDLHEFAVPGPGSRRGLNRVCGRDPAATWPGMTWRETFVRLHDMVGHEACVLHLDILNMHGQDLQNCLCEFDKYERARLGEGTPKQRYKEKN